VALVVEPSFTLLLDGWCLPLIFREVLWPATRPFVKGENPGYQPCGLIAIILPGCLQQMVPRRRAYLAGDAPGLAAPTPLPGARDLRLEARPAAHAEAELKIYTRRDGRRCRPGRGPNQITLNTLVQGPGRRCCSATAATRTPCSAHGVGPTRASGGGGIDDRSIHNTSTLCGVSGAE